MDHVLFLHTIGLLGLRLRYWAVIIIVILVIIALAYYARGRTV